MRRLVGHPYIAMRRVTDRVVAGTMLVAASPVLLGIGVAVRVRMGSPVFFRQDRIGEGGRVFRMLKFRTMVTGAAELSRSGVADADLLPPLGKFLRATSLDELPQLINIAAGDMAFIGPRPVLPWQAARYSDRHRIRLQVPQGVTGLAQVRFRHSAPWSERIEADIEYVESVSARLDARILLETVSSLLRRKGVEVHDHSEDVDGRTPSER